MSRPCALMRVNCAVLLLLAQYSAGKALAAGNPIVLQNDSFLEGEEIAYASGLREGDVGAAVFELPPEVDAFRIDGVRIFWASTAVVALNDPVACRILLVPHATAIAQQVKAATLLLNMPPGTELIFIDDFYAGSGYGASTTSLILFTQADHVGRRGTGIAHEAMQEELIAFRNRHNAQNFVKEFKPGPLEGRPVNP